MENCLLPDKKYNIIYADLPWAYRQSGTTARIRGNAVKHYSTMSTADICALPVSSICAEGAGACWGVPLYHLGMIERDAAEHQGAIVVANDRLLWDDGGEAVVVEAVRKAKSGWARAWERAVWEALEGVDLHKEEE